MTAAVIDPGGDVDVLLAACKQLGITLKYIWITHGHLDHAGATADLAEQLGLPIIGPHPGDQFWIDGLPMAASTYGFPPARAFKPTRWLADGDTVALGKHTLQVRHCPGHTPGHVVFVNPDMGIAIVGDVLFQGSIGRTDFPYGDKASLLNAIRTKLFPLGDHIQFLCGHGPASSFGAERQSNPFVGEGAA
jgi:glyoxylase-like metal-dependent hydrolase (beta-lactamase superfamily II)